MIAILVFPDFQLLDATGPAAVFELAQRLAGADVSMRMIAKEPGPVRSSCGIEVIASGFPEHVEEISMLAVVGGLGTEAVLGCQDTLDLVRRVASAKRRVVSVCTGAFILGAAGLLDGHEATTHWSSTPEFLSRYPMVRLNPDRIFLRRDNIWTSGGVTAGIDLALAVVAEDYGANLAKDVARYLVLYHHRPGGQSQFSSLLEFKSSAGRFSGLLSWIRENLDKRLTVDILADKAGVSSRHFVRSFKSETGSTPTKAVEKLRLEVARERVQSSSERIEDIAEKTGFGDAERMRRAFIRAFGKPPQSLRREALYVPAGGPSRQKGFVPKRQSSD